MPFSLCTTGRRGRREIRPIEMTKGEMAANDFAIRPRILLPTDPALALSILDVGRPPPIEHDDAEQLVGIIRKPAAVLFP